MKNILYKLYFIILITLPIILLFLPADFFDLGDSICLSVFLFDVECYACGMTRAIQHLIHFNFNQAIEYNILSLLVFPLLLYMYFKELRRVYKILK